MAAPSQACPAGSVNPLCDRCDALHQDLLSLRSESFGLNGGGKKKSLSAKRVRTFSLQCWKVGAGNAFRQPCLVPGGKDMLSAPIAAPRPSGHVARPSNHTQGPAVCSN